MQEYILDQGWEEAGIRDADGSIADLGAIPQGGKPADLITIKPTSQVMIEGTEATLFFSLDVGSGSFSNPQIKYFRFIEVEYQGKTWSVDVEPIPAEAIHEMPVNAPISVGANTVSVTVPERGADDMYGFFEMVIEGTGSNGETVTSTVGFLPYRKMENYFKVNILDVQTEDILDTVVAGDTVFLQIEPVHLDGSPFNNPIDTTTVSLQSGAPLYGIDCDLANYGGCDTFTVDRKIEIRYRVPVIFTTVPENGVEFVRANGKWINPDDSTVRLPFSGATTNGVTILPGPPEKVLFQDPPSNTLSGVPQTIDPGTDYPGKLEVYDRFENRVNQPTPVKLSSVHPQIGDFVGGAQEIETGTDGIGVFQVRVGPGANEDDIFTLQGQIGSKTPDQADMKVGKPLDKFWIFYGDTGAFNEAKRLEGQVGIRLAFQVWASQDGITVNESDNEITVTGTNSGMLFFASEDAEEPATVFPVTGGKANLWVTSATAFEDEMIEVRDVNDNTILPGSRSKVYFRRSPTSVQSAAFYSTNGLGQVDSLVVNYKEPMALVPDSLAFYWPQQGESARKSLPQSSLALSEDKLTLSIKLDEPYPEGITFGRGFGISYDRPNPNVPVDSSSFEITDKVGPILTEAKLYERFYPGNDTFVVTFSEDVNLASVLGECFSLIKAGAEPVNLELINMAVSVNGEITVRFAVPDLVDGAPQEGDSLKIMAETIEDVPGNTAHPANRPVVIQVVSKPVPIDRSWYLDLDADGEVDRIAIDFAQNIRDLSQIGVSAQWVDANINSGELSADRLSYSESDRSLIFANVEDVFSDARDRTDGSMKITVRYLNFSDQSDDDFASDSAAPVIKSARFLPGEIIDENNSEPNKLLVSFSESVVEDVTSLEEPFLFVGIGNNNYQMILRDGKKEHGEYSFLVDTLIGTDYPSGSDSIWIDAAAGIQDHSGNVQDEPGNKRVKMNVTPKPYKLTIKTGPNPFVPGKPFENIPQDLAARIPFNGGVIIKVDPLTYIDDSNGQGLEILNATIYDAVGNKIAMCADALDANERMAVVDDSDPGSSIMYIAWSGHNMQGRIVGPGTYILHFIVKGNDGKENSFVTKIGVRPQE